MCTCDPIHPSELLRHRVVPGTQEVWRIPYLVRQHPTQSGMTDVRPWRAMFSIQPAV
jgi:hypothetical protein